MQNSNLPPGCNSPDGGIDHAFEEAIEKCVDLLIDSGLDHIEIIEAVKAGIKTGIKTTQKMAIQEVLMELRWLILCDENGRKTEPVLQYREDEKDWEDVPIEEFKTWKTTV